MYIAFLWHMHQPYYKDLLKDVYLMPWTFLHAIKDYNDMVKILNEFPEIKLTFNFVSSLLDQIDDLSENAEKDIFLKMLLKNVSSLSEDEKKEILRQVFCANYENMIAPLTRFKKLYDKRDFKKYSNEEILDLEVLYLLAWSGFYIKNSSPLIKALIEKGQNFSEDDKRSLVNELCKTVKNILPEYKDKFHNGKIEISTSPYYHPILPLLTNFDSAKVALPHINMPEISNDFADDAALQISKGLDKFEKIFGKRCKGLWPSEGAVSTDSVREIIKHNISWIATDEDILFASRDIPSRKELYYPYDFNGMKIFFRDKELSNLIGFIYSKWHYKDAAQDFYSRLKSIQAEVRENAVVTVILDGENVWEFFKNNGIPFLREVYGLIQNDKSINFTLFSEYLEKEGTEKYLTYLHAGSWINANYQIWIGAPEENKAWELVDGAKTVLKKHANNKNKNFYMAREELLIAEGSDWFWWYGDDFYSEVSDKFDSLFRTHIANVYSFLNEDIPLNVLEPIKEKHSSQIHVTEPTAPINPKIDGEITDYFEWLAAGVCYCDKRNSTMHFNGYNFSKFYYGFNDTHIFIRIDSIGDFSELIRDAVLEINIHNNELCKIEYIRNDEKILFYKNNIKIVNHNIELKSGKILETAVPLDDCGFKRGEYINITVEIMKNGSLMERMPYDSTINIRIPENLQLEYWTV